MYQYPNFLCVCLFVNLLYGKYSRTFFEFGMSSFMPEALHKNVRSTPHYRKLFDPAANAAGTVLPPRGGRRIFSAIKVVFASRSMAHLIGRSRVFVSFLNVPCIPCDAKWPLVLWQPFARRVLGGMLRLLTA